MTKDKTAAVVVLYHPDESVAHNIFTYSGEVGKIYLIDNSDRKEYALDEVKQLDNVEYIDLKENRGIAAALNQGMKKAIDEGYEWVITMDQDSRFKNNIIQIYLDYINENNVDKVIMLSPAYIMDRGRKQNSKGETKKLRRSMQSACFVHVEVFCKIGYFREEFFIDCVDYEYCLKSRKQGYEIICCKKAVLVHNPGITQSRIILGREWKYGYASQERIYYQIRNALYLFSEYKSCYSLLIVVVKCMKVVFLFSHKKFYFRYIRKAFADFAGNITGKLEEKKLC